MDDAEIHADKETEIKYKLNDPFIQLYYKGQLRELVNISVIRSMDVCPPPRKCKWCQATVLQTPCEKCNR